MKTRDGRGKKVKKSTEPKVIIGMSYGGPEHTRRTLRELFLGRESHSLSVVGRQLVACGGYKLVLVLVSSCTSNIIKTTYLLELVSRPLDDLC